MDFKNFFDELLEPPERESRIAYKCAICDEPIFEGEDYYDLPTLGHCCERCVDDCKHYDAEADDNSDFEYESMREEAIIREQETR